VSVGPGRLREDAGDVGASVDVGYGLAGEVIGTGGGNVNVT
jgi:hypothetical protein